MPEPSLAVEADIDHLCKIFGRRILRIVTTLHHLKCPKIIAQICKRIRRQSCQMHAWSNGERQKIQLFKYATEGIDAEAAERPTPSSNGPGDARLKLRFIRPRRRSGAGSPGTNTAEAPVSRRHVLLRGSPESEQATAFERAPRQARSGRVWPSRNEKERDRRHKWCRLFQSESSRATPASVSGRGSAGRAVHGH